MFKRSFLALAILPCFSTFVSAQNRNTKEFINASEKIISSYTKNDLWKDYYLLDTANISFNEFSGGQYKNTYLYQKDTIVGFNPNKVIVAYRFSLKKLYRTDCFESSLYLILELDEKMELVNLGELKKIPAFILEKKKMNFIDRNKATEFGKKYSLEKGLDEWSLCINWNSELQKMTWVIESKLTNEKDPKGVTYREIEIDALDGKLLREFYVSHNEKIRMH